MKKFVKRVALIVMAMCMAAVGLVGCGGSNTPPAGDESENASGYDRLDGTQKQTSYRTDTLVPIGLQDAYEEGLLTRTDLTYAMFYAVGKVYAYEGPEKDEITEEDIEELDFAPQERCPAIDKQVEEDIKRYEWQNLSRRGDLTFEEFERNFSFRFVGCYGGTFVVTDIQTNYWAYPANVPPPRLIGDLVWFRSYAKDLYVYKYE